MKCHVKQLKTYSWPPTEDLMILGAALEAFLAWIVTSIRLHLLYPKRLMIIGRTLILAPVVSRIECIEETEQASTAHERKLTKPLHKPL